MTNAIMTQETTLHLFRCRMCCEVYSSHDRIDREASCVCGGSLNHLGQVNGGRLLKIIDGCPPCDFRCTEAVKDKCSCQCRGLNHGSHREVTITRDGGPVPFVRPSDPEACVIRRNELKRVIAALWAPVDEKFPGARESRRTGAWIDRAAFDAILDVSRNIDAAMKLTTHANRIRKLSGA